MNHRLWDSVAARVLALAFVVAGASACGERLSDVSTSSAGNANPSPSAQVIGVAPAEPKGDTPATTSPAGARGEVSAQAESTKRPLEGDNHSYSTLSPTTPQKAENVSEADSRQSDPGSTPANTAAAAGERKAQ